MNTIERVARALAEATEYTAPEHWEIWEGEAKAALEALCGGLEWFSAGESSLRWNGRQIGWIQCWCWEPDKWQVHFMGDFHKVSTREEARDALMQAARNWLMGE